MSRIRSLLTLFGFYPIRAASAIGALPGFVRDYFELRTQLSRSTDGFAISRFYPVLTEGTEDAGVAGGGYFHQDLCVARWIFERSPMRHLDVGSRIDGFVAHVAVFRQIDVADIRKLSTTARNINFVQCDLMDQRSVEQLGMSIRYLVCTRWNISA